MKNFMKFILILLAIVGVFAAIYYFIVRKQLCSEGAYDDLDDCEDFEDEDLDSNRDYVNLDSDTSDSCENEEASATE